MRYIFLKYYIDILDPITNPLISLFSAITIRSIVTVISAILDYFFDKTYMGISYNNSGFYSTSSLDIKKPIVHFSDRSKFPESSNFQSSDPQSSLSQTGSHQATLQYTRDYPIDYSIDPSGQIVLRCGTFNPHSSNQPVSSQLADALENNYKGRVLSVRQFSPEVQSFLLDHLMYRDKQSYEKIMLGVETSTSKDPR